MSHLEDVRAVVVRVRAERGVSAALLAAWVAWWLARGTVDALARGLRAGAIAAGCCWPFFPSASARSISMRRSPVSWIFFEGGTWTFPADSLIIQLFPVSILGGCGGRARAWVLLGVGLMLWGAVAVMRSPGLEEHDNGLKKCKTLPGRTSRPEGNNRRPAPEAGAQCKRQGGDRCMPAKEGYCVKCKSKREIKDAQDITMKNGRPATQGLCPECGTKIFKIGKS